MSNTTHKVHQIFAQTKQVIATHWKALLLLALFLRVVGWALVYGLGNYMDGLPLSFDGTNLIVDANIVPSMEPAVLWQTFQPFILTLSLVLLVTVIAFMLIQIFVMDMTFSTVRGKKKSYHKMFQTVSKKLIPYLGTGIVQSIFLVLLYLLLIIPGVIYSIYWLFTTAIVVYTDKTYKAAMDESKRIVKGRWRETAIYIVLLTFSFSLFQSLVTRVLSYIPQIEIAEGLISLVEKILQILIMVIVACFFMVWHDTSHAEKTQD